MGVMPLARSAAQRVGRAVREAPPSFALAVGWFVVLLYAYPGQMNRDSFEALRQARTRFFDDAHPAAYTTLWRMLEWVVAGPTAMFLVQSAMFTLGLYTILRRVLSSRAAAWCTTGLLVVPPVLVPLAMISTHAMMAGFLALGTGALLSDHRRVQIAGLAAMLGATAVQPSAVVATLPLVVLLFTWGEGKRVLRALGAWLAITVVAFGLNAVLAKQPAHAWSSSLAMFDIAGTLAHANEDVPDAALLATLGATGLRGELDVHSAIRTHYRPDDPLRLVTGEAAPWAPGPDGAAPPVKARAALARAARELASAHPGAYLRHRLAVFGELVWTAGFHPELAVPSPDPPSDALKFGIPVRVSDAQYAMFRVFEVLAERTPLFAPWLYFVVALILLVLSRGHPDVRALIASGLAFQVSQLVTATGPAYGRSHWLIASTCVAAILLIARRRRT